MIASDFKKSFEEGISIEDEFINLRGDKFIRKSTRQEDMKEHWDVLDSELGRIDIKAPKRVYRGGPIDYSIHWWEFKNVTGKDGWGMPSGVDRLIAFRIIDGFILVDPTIITPILQERCTQHYRGLWGLNTRKGRSDLAALIPIEFLAEHVQDESHVLII